MNEFTVFNFVHFIFKEKNAATTFFSSAFFSLGWCCLSSRGVGAVLKWAQQISLRCLRIDLLKFTLSLIHFTHVKPTARCVYALFTNTQSVKSARLRGLLKWDKEKIASKKQQSLLALFKVVLVPSVAKFLFLICLPSATRTKSAAFIHSFIC